VLALAAFLASAALAGSPAAIPEAGPDRMQLSFKAFASDWMAKMQSIERENRARAAGAPYKGFADQYRVELKPTGHPAAPWVGILRYDEHTLRCSGEGRETCRIAQRIPIVEIFRFQNGRWVY
jgi:hypothetical protein